jgi:hypothetical protein
MAPESRTIDRVASFRDIESLKELLQSQFAAHEREHILMESASSLAREEMNRRLDDMNGLRHQIEKAETHFVTRAEHDSLVSALDSKFSTVMTLIASKDESYNERFRSIEHYVWMGVGAAALIGVALHWLKA